MTENIYSTAMRMAAHAMERDSFDVALRHFEDALTEYPDSAEAHARLSLCLSRMGRRFGALEEAERALRIDPGYPTAHVAFGHAVLMTGDVKAAKAAAKRVAALDPESTDAARLRCAITFATREHQALKQAARELLAQAPEDVFGICMLSRAAAMTGNGAEAERLARDALALDPDDAFAHESIGWAFFAQGRFRQAKEAALSALSLQPKDESAFMLLASSSLRQRWLTGWLFWPALWIMLNSERAYMTAVILLNAALMVGAAVLRHREQREAADYVNIGSWVIAIGLLATFYLFVWILQKERRNVRLIRQY